MLDAEKLELFVGVSQNSRMVLFARVYMRQHSPAPDAPRPQGLKKFCSGFINRIAGC